MYAKTIVLTYLNVNQYLLYQKHMDPMEEMVGLLLSLFVATYLALKGQVRLILSNVLY